MDEITKTGRKINKEITRIKKRFKRDQISNENVEKINQEMIRIQNRLKSVGSNEGQVAAVETSEDGGIQGDKNASSRVNDEGIPTIPTVSQGDFSAESDRESNERRDEIKAMETKIREQQSVIAQQHRKMEILQRKTKKWQA